MKKTLAEGVGAGGKGTKVTVADPETVPEQEALETDTREYRPGVEVLIT
ncbi:MAG: hypothetical protein WCQ90_07800 [Deltaproteobacteria bacterium]